jgi:hypothetical protein
MLRASVRQPHEAGIPGRARSWPPCAPGLARQGPAPTALIVLSLVAISLLGAPLPHLSLSLSLSLSLREHLV